MPDSITSQPRIARLRPWIAVALFTYWGSLFVSTHVPIPQGVLPPGISDKTLHYVAYAGLSFLLTLWISAKCHLPLKSLAMILVWVSVYGIIDELLQIPVGRHADVFDWFADFCGTVLGITAFVACRAALPDPWRASGGSPKRD